MTTNFLRSLVVALALSVPAAHAWHQQVTLQSQSLQTMVQFDSPTDTSVPVAGSPLLPRTGDAASGGGKVTLLDLDLGHLWAQDMSSPPEPFERAVAFRLADGRFLSALGSGQVLPTVLRLASDAGTGLRDLAPEHRFKIRVREPSGTCPGALTVPDPSASMPLPAIAQTGHVTDGCLVGFTSADGTRELFVDAAGVLAMRGTTGGGADAAFRIRLLGLPPPQTLSAPFLESNRFLPFVVHVDHRRHVGGTGVRCEDGRGRAPFEPHGRPCYARHEGTDFIVRPISVGPGLTTAPIRVVAAAAGTVVGISDGNFDRCYLNPAANCRITVPSPGQPPGLRCPNPGDYQNYISCNGGPSGSGSPREANKVTVLQDDGLLAGYVHLKNGTIPLREGERVECGQVLGQVGSSGTSSLPHLHFDLNRPPALGQVVRPGSPNDRSWGRPVNFGPQQGSVELVDPYDFRDANGHDTLWTDLQGTVPSALPRLVCSHPSQAVSPLVGGLPDGSPCERTNQCRPTRVCSSAGVCEARRSPGQACQADGDCALLSRCEQHTCTRRGVALGMRCGAGLICGSRLSCVDARCALNAPPPPPPPPPPECPPGLTKKCLRPCTDSAGTCQRPGGRSCPRVCAP